MPPAPLTRRFGILEGAPAVQPATRRSSARNRRILVDIGEHVLGDLGQAGFGIPHGGRWIAVDRSIIALTIHEHIAHVEGLRHPNERIVNRTVTVGW